MGENIVLMNGTNKISIMRGNIDIISNLINITGKDKGFLKRGSNFFNVPLELMEKEKELYTVDNKPTGIKVIQVRQSVDGDRNYNWINTKMVEEYNSLITENATLKREVATLKRKTFDLNNKDRFQENALKDLKWSGKARSALYSFEGQEGGINRFDAFRRPFSSFPPDV